MVSDGPGRGGPAWVALKRAVFTEERVCWLCTLPVDQDLPLTHRLGRTVDHLIQLDHDGPALDRGNARLAHRSCNTSRSNRLRRLPRWQCACRFGMPCAQWTDKPRYLSVAIDSI